MKNEEMMLEKMGTMLYERLGHVALVTLNRPQARNAYDDQMQGEMAQVWRHVRGNPDVWAMVLTGSGEESFCAGRDVKELAEFQAKDKLVPRYDPQHPSYGDFGAHLHKYNVGKPIIGAINGYAIGGGLGLVLSCDLRVVSSSAWFGDLHVNIGQIGGATRILQQMPYAVACELVLAGRRLDAERAREVGLVNEVVPPDQVLPRALALAEEVCQMSPTAVQRSKQIMQTMLDVPSGTLELEEQYMAQQRLTEDGKEGPRAFRERRRPQWTGR